MLSNFFICVCVCVCVFCNKTKIHNMYIYYVAIVHKEKEALSLKDREQGGLMRGAVTRKGNDVIF